ncbi:microcephalin [Nothobranchius furzeri]|uniref:Microcephalin 1 n=4 Tax=Nothobranchius TaxID=28779 RepID=A0A1A8ASR6_NOTFU|nr:microcephalin 1 [Nothobranchius furzeri]
MTSSNNSSLLKDVVAYVDVWSSDKRANYSKSFIQQLEKMGAQASNRFNKQVTHVIFNNGHPATWRKAKKTDVRLVSALWVGRCYDDGERADEDLFPAVNDESNPVMKNRKHRCMLPKDSPEKTTNSNWRLKKKLDKMLKDLPSIEPDVTDKSPVIIDHENGIIYSPALKRSNYMAQRLRDMKDKHENISPTSSQMAASCSPTEQTPSLGSSPTVFKFQLNDQSDDPDASPAELGCSPDKEEDPDHLEHESSKPWLSPCRDLPERFSSFQDCPEFENQGDKEEKLSKSRRTSIRIKAQHSPKFENQENKKEKNNLKSRTSVRKQAKFKPGDSLSSPILDKADGRRVSPKAKSQSLIKSAKKLPYKCENKQIMTAEKSCTDTKGPVSPGAACPSSAATLVDATTEISKQSFLLKNTLLRTPKTHRMSLSALVRSGSLCREQKSVAMGSTGDDAADVFEDYFCPANNKRLLLPNLPESSIQIPFELDSATKKRKEKRRESCSSSTKKLKLEISSPSINHPSQTSRKNLSQHDVPDSLPALDSQSVNERQRQSTSKRDAGKHRPSSSSSSGQPPSQTEDISELEPQKNSDFPIFSHTAGSGGNECLVAAGFTEIPSEFGENHNKQVSLRRQKMVTKTKAMRTLVMTSMPSEKQNTVVQVVKALGGFSIVDRVCESTTHVVSGGHRRTLNILLGIARGCWILSFEWILWCLEQSHWIPEEPYELSEQFPAAQICRLQRHLSAGEHQQDLFQNLPAMFVSQHSQPPSQTLVELIELCGGQTCKTVRRAGICIGRHSGRRPEGCRMLSEQWILDCITHLKIQSYDTYYMA